MKTTTLSASAQTTGRGRSVLRERPWARAAFTLTELLMVMMILALVSTMAATAFSGMMQQSRIERTRVVIRKIDTLLMEKWEGYRTRPIPIRVPMRRDNGTLVTPVEAARVRLAALRQMQRMEMPEMMADVYDNPSGYNLAPPSNNPPLNPSNITIIGIANPIVLTSPSLRSAYQRAIARAFAQKGVPWSSDYEGAECLYLILSNMQDGEKRAIDFFTNDEIGDIDDDGMKEFLDPWGTPIQFLRWSPGYTKNKNVVTSQTNDRDAAPDQFDAVQSDPRWLTPSNDPSWSQPLGPQPFALRPLVFSAGPDKALDIKLNDHPNATNDPFLYAISPNVYIGTPYDTNSDGSTNYGDNITNHDPQGN